MKLTINSKVFTGIIVITAAVVMMMFSFIKNTHANPSFFLRSQSASATTTVSYMTPGTATTTSPSFDTGVGAAQGADSAVLLTRFVGSTSAAILNITLEYSQDNIDWYSDRLSAGATTTQAINITQSTTYSLTAQGNNPGGIGGTASSTLRSIVVPTPTRYVRAVYSIPVGSTNGSVWGEFVAKRQNP